LAAPVTIAHLPASRVIRLILLFKRSDIGDSHLPMVAAMRRTIPRR
jgi:hypothetical protein